MKNISVKLTIHYGTIVGTVVALAGLLFLFLSHDATGASVIIGLGLSAILGRTALQKLDTQNTGGYPSEKTV